MITRLTIYTRGLGENKVASLACSLRSMNAHLDSDVPHKEFLHADERTPIPNAILDAFGVLFTRESVFCEAERAAADLLEVRFDVPERGQLISTRETKYDFCGACPRCLTGAKLIGPVALDGREFSKPREISHNFGHPLLREHLAAALAADLDVARDLFPTIDLKSRAPLPWRAIAPRMTLPPFLPRTQGITRGTDARDAPCPACNRDGYFHEGKEAFLPFLERKAVVAANKEAGGCGEMPILAASWEAFGVGARPCHPVPHVAEPRLFANQTVYQWFKAKKVRRLAWTPAVLE